MSYLVLARKYRPKSFAEVAGQEAVTRTLAGAIAENRIGHAYLFTGPRGTGKTTSARLFAKALNCEQGPTVTACGVCDRCLASDSGAEADIVEIDGASNNGVADVRELRDRAAYAPLRARFKIYIIDEVHMLSKAAFNALLKTLEEPPPHVKFLLATTEPHKVLDTIISRCQVLRLSPISEETIARRLEEVFAAEKVVPEAGVGGELARRARGGMRDALSMADQLLALVGSRPTLADLEGLSNEGSSTLIEELLTKVEAGDKAGLLRALPTSDGGEGELLSGILDHLRACLIVALCGADAPMLSVEVTQRRALAARAQRLGVERLELWLRQCLQVRERLRLLPTHSRLALEVALLELARPELGTPISELVGRLEGLERRLLQGGAPIEPPASLRSGGDAAFATASQASGPAPAAPARPIAQARAPSPAQVRARPDAPGAATGASSRSGAAEREPGPQAVRAAAESSAAPGPSVSPARPARPAQTSARPAQTSAAGPAATQAALDPEELWGEGDSSDEGDALALGDDVPVTQRLRANSRAEAWEQFLLALGARASGLADSLTRRGRLMVLDQARAVIRLAGMQDSDRLMLEDARNRRLAALIFSELMGRELTLDFEDADVARPGQSDAFTSEVAGLFEGRIED